MPLPLLIHKIACSAATVCLSLIEMESNFEYCAYKQQPTNPEMKVYLQQNNLQPQDFGLAPQILNVIF